MRIFFILLIFISSVLFANPAITKQRNEANKNYNTNSGSPSDIPYNLYDANIESDIRQVVDRTDLSQGLDSRLFIGYGLYDKENRYCRYVPVGTLDQFSFNNDFEQEESYINHSYFISRFPMTYSECLDEATKYNAKVYTPQSDGEAYSLQIKYEDEIFWVGFYRDSCSAALESVSGERPNYDNWYSVDKCLDELGYEQKNVIQLSNGKITNAKGGSSYKCVIEFDSPDYTRPQKVCAPWWRVERKYKYLNTNPPIFDVSHFTKIPVPVSIYWCKPPYDPQGEESVEIEKISVTCTTYQSATAQPFCATNIDSSACFVDECQGIIKEKCTQPKEIELYKDYMKGTLVGADGAQYIGKIRKDIKTYSYSCPKNYARSGEDCEEYIMYKVFPALCVSPEDINETNATLQLGSPRRPAYDDGSGNPIMADINPATREDEPIGFFSRCDASDDDFLFSPINKISTSTKRCLRFEENNTTKTTYSDCVVDRIYTEHEVQVALNEDDIYEYNATCIRTNNIQNARPVSDINIEIGLMGNSVSKIDKISSGAVFNQATYNDDEYYKDFVMKLLGYNRGAVDSLDTTIDEKQINIAQIENIVNESNLEESYGVLLSTLLQQNRDSVYGGKIFYSDSYYYLNLGQRDYATCNKYNNSDINGTILFQGNINSFDEQEIAKYGLSANDLIQEANLTKAKIASINENNETVYICPQGYSEDPDNNNSCLVDSFECVVKGWMSSSSFAISSTYQESSESGFFILKPMTKVECVSLAISLNFSVYNFNSFSSGSDIKECQLLISKNNEVSYDPVLAETKNIEGTYDVVDYNIFISKTVDELSAYYPNVKKIKTLDFKVNGASDILAIQEYTSGDHFGWYQSSLTRLYEGNSIEINEETLSVIPRWPIAIEKLNYHYHGTQTVKTTKQPYVSLFDWGRGTSTVEDFSSAGIRTNPIYSLLNTAALLTLGSIDFLYSSISGMLAGEDKYVNNTQSWTLTKELDLPKIQSAGLINDYKYETRSFEDSSGDGVLNQAVYYKQLNMNTGAFKNNNALFENRLNEMLSLKIDMLQEMSARDIGKNFGVDIEKQRVLSYPKCDFWETSCNKSKSVSRTADFIILKNTSTHYLQATNRLIIVVPYIGDYKVSALNAMGKIMADKNISKNSFIPSSGNQILYTQVQFGKTMDLANGISDGNTSAACRVSDVVEWGGGVSGIYYEEQGYLKTLTDNTNIAWSCEKSSDIYVAKNSPNQIIVKDLSTNSIITIPLMGKMPYPNQIFFVTLGKKELKKYACYDMDYPQCAEVDYKNEENN